MTADQERNEQEINQKYGRDWPQGQASAGSAGAPEPFKPIDSLFGLKILVVGLGVLLLVAILTFFILLFTKGIKKDEAEVEDITADFAVSAQSPLPQLSLLTGEEITHMALNEGELALHLVGPAGERILLIDPYTADHKSVINLTRATPDRE